MTYLHADLVANNICEPWKGETVVELVYLTLWGIFYRPAFSCVFWFRVNQWMHQHRIWGYNLLSARRQVWFGNYIDFRCKIGAGFRITHFSDINISPCTIGKNFTVNNGVTIGKKDLEQKAWITIGDNVTVGTGTKILGGTFTIGNNVTIGALTLINCEIPSDTLVYGIPPNRTIKPC